MAFIGSIILGGRVQPLKQVTPLLDLELLQLYDM